MIHSNHPRRYCRQLDTGIHSADSNVAASSADVTLQVSPSSILRGRYKSYSVNEKKNIVDEARLHGIYTTADNYHIPKSTVMTWIKTNFTTITSNTRGARAVGGGRKVKYNHDNDAIILQCILEQRDLNIHVSRESIQEYARRLLGTDHPDFKASRGWLERLMRRHNLSLRSKTTMS